MIIAYVAKERQFTFSLSFLMLLPQMLGYVAEKAQFCTTEYQLIYMPWASSCLIYSAYLRRIGRERGATSPSGYFFAKEVFAITELLVRYSFYSYNYV